MTKQDIMSALLGILADGALGHPRTMQEIGLIRGVSAARQRAAMHALMAAGLVKRTGNTRGTRYQAVGL